MVVLLIGAQYFNTIIDRGSSEQVRGREALDGLNDTYKRFLFHLISTVQLPSSKRFDTEMTVHTTIQNTDASLALESQKHLSNK